MIICTPLSQLLPVKNVAGVIEAVALSKEKHIINIVGGGDTKELEKLAKNLGILKQIKFWGSLPKEEAGKVLKKSDVFVLNSFHEGLPHAVIEALAQKVPVIATRIPAMTEILKDRKTALLVNVNDPKDLSEKMALLPAYQKILVQNGRKLYEEKFTWDSHLEKLLALFNSLKLSSS